jgi:hydrogenase maturation protease
VSAVVVVGVGNALRGDDAAGLLAAAGLRALALPGVTVLDHGGEALALLDAWAGADEVIVVDAVRTGAATGTLHRWEAGETALVPPPGASSSHALGLLEAIELGRALGRLPRKLVLWGVEARELAAGRRPSREVAAAIPRLVDAVRREIAGTPAAT